METRRLQEVLTWMRGTDLTEVSYRKGDDGVEVKLEGRNSVPSAAFPATTLLPVSSTGVGLFRWSAPGKARKANEGASVAEGDLLGLLETGAEPVEIKAPAAGRLVKVLVDDGKPVEYGQPLFLIAP
ncbi:MAG: biotin/lipoyl-binding protein [Elusimicrobia bacterium]|nr:biotin/lipoyl-binding protein [Elusimicrobiota bacterium]